MKPITIITLAAAVLWAAAVPALAENPTDTAMNAWGGRSAFEALGVIKLEVEENATGVDGTRQHSRYTLFLDTETGKKRMELPDKEVVIVAGDTTGWATAKGILDDRPQTARYAPGFINMKLFPALLPFTLGFEGVTAETTTVEGRFDGKPAAVLAVTVREGFFTSPLVNTHWQVFLEPGNLHFLGARFTPTPGFEGVKNNVGMRFKVTETARLGNLTIPSRITAESIDAAGATTGNRQDIVIKASILSDPSPALFLHPEALRALEGDD